jgi:hypothetical protein
MGRIWYQLVEDDTLVVGEKRTRWGGGPITGPLPHCRLLFMSMGYVKEPGGGG